MERTDTCKLCYEVFGDKLRPRGLHCGHSYCTDCLDKLFDNGNLSCPKCKRNHRISSARDFSINYDLEQSLLDFRKAKVSVAPSSHSNSKIEMMIAEQKTTVHNLVLSAEDMRSQLKAYKDFLLIRKAKHETVLQKIRDLGSLHEELVEEIKEDLKRIMDVQEEGDGYGEKVNEKLPNLDNAVTNKAAVLAVAEVVECLGDLEGWIDQCQHEFPYPNITAAEQILKRSIDALLLADSETDKKVPVASSSSSSSSSGPSDDQQKKKIMEKQAEIDELTLTLDKLRDKPDHWMKRIAEGQVCAVDSSNGRKRSAVLSERDGKIYLRHLQDREAPVLAYTIEQSEVVKSLNKDSTVVFLDLAWDDSLKGRVHILLSPDTPLARHFRILCTGDLGPSYAHSKFFTHQKNSNAEYIIGGDYEYNDGTGGAPVMEGLDKNDDIYYRQCEQGSVVVPSSANTNQIAKFCIVIGCPSSKGRGCFGKVKDGIEIVRDAARFRDIKEVEIINCGVQLSLCEASLFIQ